MGSLPKTKKKNLPRSVNEMSKEMLQETLKKKKECNAKALGIVEKLCEAFVDENWFLENLQFINQCHFDDVMVERSILQICGYPLCQQKLQNVTAQQYHISTRYNKVFDITERKKFCSSCCYKSAIHVKKQLFTSPLWFRDQEVIPKYSVLKYKSSLGEEVVMFPDKIKLDKEDLKMNVPKTKEVSGPKRENISDQLVSNLVQKCLDLKIHNSQDDSADEKILNNDNDDIKSSQEENKKVKDNNKNSKTLKKESDKENEIIKEIEHDNITKKNEITQNSKQENPKKTKINIKREIKPVDPVSKAENSVFEWFSLETLFYLYKEEKLKELFSDKINEIKQALNSKLSVASINDKIDKMIQLYGLLDADVFSNNEIKTNLKPVPDYAALKAEADSVEIKVKAFYQGNLELKQPPKEEKKKEEKNADAETEAVYLPLIDAHAQVPHRRKILLDKLVKVLPDLMKILSSDYVLQMGKVRSLISTFTLSAHNITFKPTEWYLVGIIVLKLLAVKDKILESALKSKTSEDQISVILESYGLQKDYLENLVIRLIDSENIIKKVNEMNR